MLLFFMVFLWFFLAWKWPLKQYPNEAVPCERLRLKLGMAEAATTAAFAAVWRCMANAWHYDCNNNHRGVVFVLFRIDCINCIGCCNLENKSQIKPRFLYNCPLLSLAYLKKNTTHLQKTCWMNVTWNQSLDKQPSHRRRFCRHFCRRCRWIQYLG